MSLEDQIAGLREDIKANTAALKAILGSKPSAAAAAPAAAPAKAPTENKKAGGAPEGIEACRVALRKFIDPSNPDVPERKAVLAKAFEQMKATDVQNIPEKLQTKFVSYLEKKDAELKEALAAKETQEEPNFLSDDGEESSAGW